MLKLFIAVCLFVCVTGLNQHPPNHAGDTHCGSTADCPDCNHGELPLCDNHLCVCQKHNAIRATCHSDKDCDSGCPSGQNGVCNSQNRCECGDHVPVAKRAGETCSTTMDCDAALTCEHGGTPTCEKHNDHDGHCHCKH